MKYGYTYTYDGETTKKVDVLNLGATPFYVNDVYIDSNERKLVKFTDNTKELYFTGQGSLDFVMYKPEAYKPVANYPVQKYQTHELLAPLSKVTMYYADDKAFSSGDDSGSELIIDSLWATQDTTDYVFSLLNNFEYVPIKSSGVYADTTIQLGDVIEVNDLRQTIINIDWTFDGKGIANIETPQNNEENYDDPYNTLVQNQFKRKVSLGDSYQGVTIDRQNGLQMLYSPDGTEANATGKYYADLNKGMAFQYRDTPLDEWNDWLYFDKNEKVFKLSMYSTSEETNQRFVDLEIDLDGVRSTVESFSGLSVNLIYNLSMTVGDYYGWEWEDTESIPLVLPFAYKFNLQYGTNFEIVNVLGSLSKTGQSFFNDGKALSPYGYVRGEAKYSARFKITEGHGIKIEVREYNKEKELIHSKTFDFTGLGFHELSIITKEATNFVRLVYTVEGVSVAKRVIVADSIFNRGEPRNWEETPNDFEFWTRSQMVQLRDSISSTAENLIIVDGRTQSNKSQILQQADLITSTVERVDSLDDDVSTNKSNIAQTAEQIELKVSKGDIASTINLTDQSVSIDASKINLSGYTTFTEAGSLANTAASNAVSDRPTNWELANQGYTTIHGGNIVTGTINFDGATGNNVDLTGKITATDGYIGGWRIYSDEIYSTYVGMEAGKGFYAGSSYFSTSSPFNVDTDGKLRARNAVIDGSITARDGYIGGFSIYDVHGGDTPHGHLYGGSGRNVVLIESGSSVSAIRAGGIDQNAPFQLDKDGDLFVENATTGSVLYTRNIYPRSRYSGDNERNIGNVSERYRRLYTTLDANVSSDIRLKNDIEKLPDELVALIAEIEPIKYKLNGHGDDWHFGYSAQDVERALYRYVALDKTLTREEIKEKVDKFDFLQKGESFLSLGYRDIEIIKTKANVQKIKLLEARIEQLEELVK